VLPVELAGLDVGEERTDLMVGEHQRGAAPPDDIAAGYVEDL
jgi:hypothetical protein